VTVIVDDPRMSPHTIRVGSIAAGSCRVAVPSFA
jgi:hypothetical protein